MTYDYDVGDDVRCSVTFLNEDGDEANPTTVTFRIRDPEGEVTPYVFDTDPEVVNSAPGRFYVIVDATKPGTWTQHWFSTGEGKAAKFGTFTVAPPAF